MQDVIIAILSAVEPPLPACLESVEKQEGDPYLVMHVTDLFPMAAAFNAMVDRCESRFIVQVDSDVVLEPWAVSRLYNFIRCTPLVYMAWGQLWEQYDDGLRPGGAVRIWRRWPLRLFRFRDRRCVDRDLHNRIRWMGMRRVQIEAGWKFGTHFPRQTPFARFSKARGDAMKWRYLCRWDLIEAANAKGFTQEGLHGFVDGLLSENEEVNQSKNLQRDWHRFLVRPKECHASSQSEAAAQEGLRRL